MTDQNAEVCCEECTAAGRTTYLDQARFHADKAVAYARQARAHADDAVRHADEAMAISRKVDRLAAVAVVLVVAAVALLFI